MAPVREAHKRHPIQVEAVPLGMVKKVCHSRVAIDHLGGKHCLGAKPVIDGCQRIALLQNGRHGSLLILHVGIFVVAQPLTPVNPDNQRNLALRLRRQVNIQQVLGEGVVQIRNIAV